MQHAYSDPPPRHVDWLVVNNKTKNAMRRKYAVTQPQAPPGRVKTTSLPQTDEGIVTWLFGLTQGYRLARPVQGDYSSTFILPGKSRGSLRRAIRTLRDTRAFRPRTRTNYVIKVTTPQDGHREAEILRYLQSSSATRAPCQRHSVRRYVPPLYAAGLVGTRYVLISEYIVSRPWSQLSGEEKALVAPQYEDAVKGMWAAGVIHADLHDNNVLVSVARNRQITQDSRVFLIDMGFAVRLPKDLHQGLLQRLCANPNKALSNESLKQYVRTVQTMYGRSMMHWNIHSLRRASSSSSGSG